MQIFSRGATEVVVRSHLNSIKQVILDHTQQSQKIVDHCQRY